MLNSKYNNSLNLILSTNEELKQYIIRFIESMPQSMRNEIEKSETEGLTIKNNCTWNFVDDGEDLNIVVGTASRFSNKEYMSIQIHNVSLKRLQSLARYRDEEMLGCVTFYLYDPQNRLNSIQLSYDAYLERNNDKYYVTLRTYTNSFHKNNADIIEKNNLTTMVKSIRENNVYQVDMKKILPSKASNTGR